jgi:cytochrome P450
MTTAHTTEACDLGSIPCLEWLRAPRFRSDPYALYAHMRTLGNVHRDPSGSVIVLGHEVCGRALRDPRLSSERTRVWDRLERGRGEEMRALRAVVDAMMVYRDGSAHARLRRLVGAAFAPKVVRSYEPMITREAERRVALCRALGTADFIAEVATPLSVFSLGRILDVPESHWADLARWEVDVACVLGASVPDDAAFGRAADRVAGLVSLFGEWIADRRRRSTHDVLGALVHARDADDALDDAEIVATCLMLVMAGRTTTVHLLGNAVRALAVDEGAVATLRRGVTDAHVNELARVDSPAQLVTRIAREPLELDGIVVARGDIVRIVLGAANHDPDAFPRPNAIDFARPGRGTVVFGQGAHYCIGAAIATIETRAVLDALVRAPFSRAPGAVAFLPTDSLRGTTSLPLRFGHVCDEPQTFTEVTP